jgi:carboxyl-terminal processing protease
MSLMPRITKLFLGLIVFGLIFTSGFKLGQATPEGQKYPEVILTRDVPADKKLDFSLFWTVWDSLERKYFDKEKLVPAKMVYGAIKGMVESVGDPYTTFLPPDENKVTGDDLSGNFGGVGIQIGFRGTQLAVVNPLAGTPAEAAGVLPGDFIIHIKDEQKGIDRGTVGISLLEAVAAIRGPQGSSVKITLLREGNETPFEVELKRQTIDVPSVTLEFVGNDKNIAHVRISKFGEDTKKELDRAIIEIQKKSDVKGIIVDVRSDPGGYLQGAVDIGGEFMESGSVVVIEERAGEQRQEYKTQQSGRLKEYKLVVLVNKGSASASEILAGALRDIKGVKLVGTVTFGKGTIQERQELPGGVALHVTAAKWLTPKGVWVHEKGLEPDVRVEDNVETPEDEQLDKAVEMINQ